MTAFPISAIRSSRRLLPHLATLGASLLLFGMMVVTFVDVVARYFFNSPIPAAFEVTEVMLGTLVFSCLPLVSAARDHVTIDLVDSLVPRNLLGFHIRFVELVMAATFGAMAVAVWIQAEKATEAAVGTEVLRIPVGPIGFFMSVMLCIAALVSLANIFRRPSSEPLN